jgi:hypothetical protein
VKHYLLLLIVVTFSLFSLLFFIIYFIKVPDGLKSISPTETQLLIENRNEIRIILM